MAYSILNLAPCGEYILYCSEQKKAILMGSQSEMEDWKHTIEQMEVAEANREYFDQIREERLAMLISAGHTQQSATDFLTKQMPYLYQQ